MNDALPPRWGPIPHQTWPQDDNRVPSTPGMPMPTVSPANALRDRRESFTVSGTFTMTPAIVVGQVIPLIIPTDPDGDFWCDQIAMTGWSTLFAPNTRVNIGTLSIFDLRTSRSLTYPDAIPVNFLTTLQLYSDDVGFDPASSPFPDGFRSTTVLPQPFCFTRAGGIQLYYTALTSPAGGGTLTADISFSGWKEYESASI